MSTYYYAVNPNGEYLFDNLPGELKYLISDFQESIKPFEINLAGSKVLARIGRKANGYGTIYTLTTEDKYVNRYKLFKELINLSIVGLKPFVDFQSKLINDQISKTQEFIHNVTSLNSYSIQSLFALIPQNTLSENINKQDEIIKNIINEKPNVTVSTLLKLIKYNLAMKVEFSVFERTQKPSILVQKMTHSVRSIILSILQIFIEDFDHLKIEVSLDAGDVSQRRIEVDDDSLFVSLYYLFDNSIKYCCPDTKYKIIFKEEANCFSVLFIMISIKIQKNEVDKLCVNGYRSDLARQVNKDGNGIGMYRILKTLKLNNAELEITPRINQYTKKNGNVEYEGNLFKIKFMGQQNWFNT
jgi:hypothetical protein